VLAVHVDQGRAEGLEVGHRRQRSAEKGATPALREDFAARHDRAAFHRVTPLLQEGARRPVGGDVELRLNRCALLGGADHFRTGPAAQDEGQRVDEDRFSGARLSGEQVQTGSQLERQLANDREMFDMQATEHRTRLVEGAMPRGFDRRRMVSEGSRVVKERSVC